MTIVSKIRIMKQRKKFRGFALGIGSLLTCDSQNVKDRIKKVNGWSDQTYGQKESGKRCTSDFNHNGINEIANIEAIFSEFGIDAWTGKELTPS